MKKRILGIFICMLMISSIFGNVVADENPWENMTMEEIIANYDPNCQNMTEEEIAIYIEEVRIQTSPEVIFDDPENYTKEPLISGSHSPTFEPPWSVHYIDNLTEEFGFGTQGGWQGDTDGYQGWTDVMTSANLAGEISITNWLVQGFYFLAPVTDTYTFTFNCDLKGKHWGQIHGIINPFTTAVASSQTVVDFEVGSITEREDIAYDQTIPIIWQQYTTYLNKHLIHTIECQLSEGTHYLVRAVGGTKARSLGVFDAAAETHNELDDYSESGWGDGVIINSIVIDWPNRPPETPEEPDGPSEGTTGIEYTYSTEADDPDGDYDSLHYKWDWDDEISDWIGPYDSGEYVEENHTWNCADDYDVKVKVKDSYDEESDWSPPKTVTISDINPPDTWIVSGPSGSIDYNDFTFTWSGSDDETPTENLEYKYMLEGYDSSWSNWISYTSKDYNDVPDGGYTFKVKARDEAHNEDPSPANRSFIVEINPPPPDPDWPMFHHDIESTGFSLSSAPNVANLLWSRNLDSGSAFWSSPAIKDDKLYVGCAGYPGHGLLFCVDAITGDILWEYNTGDTIWSSPAVYDDKVYVGSWDNSVYCLDAENGNYIWSYETGDRIYDDPIVNDDRLYVGSFDNNFYCFDADPSDGVDEGYNDPSGVEYDIIWIFSIDGHPSSCALAYGYIYITGAGIYCLNAETGSIGWQEIGGRLAVYDGKVYTSTSKVISCYNALNGDEIWNTASPTGECSPSTPAIAYDNVYMGCGDNICCFDADTGSVKWSSGGGWYYRSSPAIADSKVYIGSYDTYELYCFDAYNGDELWSYNTGWNIETSPAIADGIVYLANGYVFAFGDNRPPGTPSNPNPYDGESFVDINADLSWTGGDPDAGDTVTYDVYFGDSSPPPQVVTGQSGTTYTPDDVMTIGTTYYWKIVAWDNHGLSTEGPIWSFTTGNHPPYEPGVPDPYDGEPFVDINADLSWTGGDPDAGNTVTYDVYFGTTNPPPQVEGNQSETYYDLGVLQSETTYYWKIVAWDNHGASTEGPIWSFTTQYTVPDLDCDGSLSWIDVNPGSTVTGSFTVKNIGEPGSLLDWEITEYPYDWGNWTFTPTSGDDLTPENGPVSVDVSVISPNVEDETFYGEIKVINREDSSDFDIISVSLITPYSQPPEGKGTCFLAGTQITMANGSYKNIENIIVGDTVKSYNVTTSEIVNATVTEVYNHTSDEMPDYYLVINNKINVTPNHIVFINDTLMRVKYAKVGDVIVGIDGEDTTIDSIDEIFEKVPTYNFEFLLSSNLYIAYDMGAYPLKIKINKPAKPIGVYSVDKGVDYSYSTSTTDVAGGQIFYQFDWGDDSELSDWIGPFASGATCNATHTWTEQGYYDIIVRAKDESGDVSCWSDPLPIVAPFDSDPEPEVGISPSIHNIEDFQLDEISIGDLNMGDDVIESVTDVIGSSEIYHYGAKIKNIGSTDIEGYLRTIVRYFDETSEQWITLNDPVNDTTPKTINSGKHLALGPVFKGRVHTRALTNGNGNYRVYAVFGDSDGNVLKCADDTYLVVKCEFTVTGV